MKKLLFALLGLVTALVLFYSDISDSYILFIKNTRLLISFSVVALVSAYAYFFIHKVLYQHQSDE